MDFLWSAEGPNFTTNENLVGAPQVLYSSFGKILRLSLDFSHSAYLFTSLSQKLQGNRGFVSLSMDQDLPRPI